MLLNLDTQIRTLHVSSFFKILEETRFNFSKMFMSKSNMPFQEKLLFLLVKLSINYCFICFLSSLLLTLLCWSLGSAHGSLFNRSFALEKNVSFNNGMNYVSLLSVMVGLPVSFNLISLIFFIYFAALIQGKQLLSAIIIIRVC
jgi:hypothetical protein